MADASGGPRGGDPGVRALGRRGGAAREGGPETCLRSRPGLPPWDAGPWPEGFTVSREQIYDDMGRLTGGPEKATGDDG